MVDVIKRKPFQAKDDVIDLHNPRCDEKREIVGSKTKLMCNDAVCNMIMFTITFAIVVAGILCYTIYHIVDANTKKTVDESLPAMNINELLSNGHEIKESPETKTYAKATSTSNFEPEKTKSYDEGSSTTTNKPNLHDCPKNCPLIYRPVCGTDNETYSNLCTLKHAACKMVGESLTMAYEGSCEPRIDKQLSCCLEINLGSNGSLKLEEWNNKEIQGIQIMGRYKFHSMFNDRPMYKSVRFNFYLVWKTKMFWSVTENVNSSMSYLINSLCKEKCVENCFKGWEVGDGKKWITDNKLEVKCNNNSSGHDVDPCSKNKPLDLASSKNKTGSIVSPYIRYQYQTTTKCEWRISADTGHTIKLTFLELAVVNEGFEEIIVYDGDNMLAPMIGRFTGNISAVPDTAFSKGPDIYIQFNSYRTARLGNFKLEYATERCDWNDWEVGQCSKTCGGGYKTKVRTLQNDVKDVTRCGSSSIKEPCNVKSCTDPVCKMFKINSRTINSTFTLQAYVNNEKIVYMSSSKEYLYSVGGISAAWVIGKFINFKNPVIGFNPACKDDETPINCNYKWILYFEGQWIVDSSTKFGCEEFE